MGFPLLGYAAAAGAGLVGWQWWKKRKEVSGGPLPGTVSALKQGTTYGVMVALAPYPAAPEPTRTVSASQFLTGFFASNGFEIVTPFAARDADAKKAFDASLTSTWVGVCRWTRSEPMVTGEGHPQIGQAVFTPLPTA